MKDYLGNNIVKVEQTVVSESRFKPGFDYHDVMGHVILIEWTERPGFWDNRKWWKCKIKEYWKNSYSEGWLEESSVLRDVGIWVFNPISGETFEYIDEHPVGVNRPINLKDGLK